MLKFSICYDRFTSIITTSLVSSLIISQKTKYLLNIIIINRDRNIGYYKTGYIIYDSSYNRIVVFSKTQLCISTICALQFSDICSAWILKIYDIKIIQHEFYAIVKTVRKWNEVTFNSYLI